MIKTPPHTIGNIYAAVGKPEAWTALMADLCSLLKATVGIWVTPGQGQRDQSFYAAYNHSERVARAYSDYWWQHDVWLQAAYKKGLVRTGMVAIGVEFVSSEELRASVFYRDFLSTIPIEHFLVVMVEDGADQDNSAPPFADVLPTHISFFRPPGAEPFTQDDKAVLTELHPHFRRAYNMHCQWRALQEQLHVFHTSINSLDFGVAFIDAAQRVRHANTAANSLAHRLWPGAAFDAAGRAKGAARHPASQQLHAMANAAAAGQSSAVKPLDCAVAFTSPAQPAHGTNAAANYLAPRLWAGAAVDAAASVAAALRQPANQQLQALVNAAALGQGGAVKLQGTGNRASNDGACQVVAIAMTVANPGASLAGKVRASVLLLMVDSTRRPDAAAEFLVKAFELTKSEARLLPLLIKGSAPAEIAAALGLKLPTVRTQLSAIFAKTGSARQQDLLALAGNMPPLADLAAAQVAA